MSHPLPSRQTGFTLIEVMVAILILGIGLLGLAGLQTMGMRASTGSYVRTQAITIAQNLAERMRLNKINAVNVAVNGVAYPYDGLVDFTCDNLVPVANPTPAQIAAQDMDDMACFALANFNLSLADNAATANINEQGINVSCPTPPLCQPNVIRTITVSWQENGLTGALETKNVQVQMVY